MAMPISSSTITTTSPGQNHPLKRKRPFPSESPPSSPSSPSSASSILSDSDSDLDSSDSSPSTSSQPSSPNFVPSQSPSSSLLHADDHQQPPPLKSRLTSFLPLLAASNAILDERTSVGKDGFEISSVDDEQEGEEVLLQPLLEEEEEEEEEENPSKEDEDDKGQGRGPYIEMDLSLGVLEEVDNDQGSSSSSSSSSPSASDDDDAPQSQKLKTLDKGQAAETAILHDLTTIGQRPKKQQKKTQPGIFEVS